MCLVITYLGVQGEGPQPSSWWRRRGEGTGVVDGAAGVKPPQWDIKAGAWLRCCATSPGGGA